MAKVSTNNTFEEIVGMFLRTLTRKWMSVETGFGEMRIRFAQTLLELDIDLPYFVMINGLEG